VGGSDASGTGANEGDPEGAFVGDLVGAKVGSSVGDLVGAFIGDKVGVFVGDIDGRGEGTGTTGERVGASIAVGRLVGGETPRSSKTPLTRAQNSDIKSDPSSL